MNISSVPEPYVCITTPSMGDCRNALTLNVQNVKTKYEAQASLKSNFIIKTIHIIISESESVVYFLQTIRLSIFTVALVILGNSLSRPT